MGKSKHLFYSVFIFPQAMGSFIIARSLPQKLPNCLTKNALPIFQQGVIVHVDSAIAVCFPPNQCSIAAPPPIRPKAMIPPSIKPNITVTTIRHTTVTSVYGIALSAGAFINIGKPKYNR